LGSRVQHERVHEAPCEDPHDLHVLVGLVRRGAGCRIRCLPAWASLRHVLGASVGLVLRYPFATQDTERNSSDECARDPRRTSHDLRRTNLASQIVRRYKKGGEHSHNSSFASDVTADTALSEGLTTVYRNNPPALARYSRGRACLLGRHCFGTRHPWHIRKPTVAPRGVGCKSGACNGRPGCVG